MDSFTIALVADSFWLFDFQEQVKILSDRAVAYLNVDLAIEGNASMRAKGTPLLYNILYKVAKDVRIWEFLWSNIIL